MILRTFGLLARLGGLLLALAACLPDIPATTPPQLGATVGVALTILSDEVLTDAYRLRYPQGWRVVKANPADSLTQLVFVSPDEQTTITLHEQASLPAVLSIPTPSAGNLQLERRLSLADRTLYLRLEAPQASFEQAQALFEAMLDSLQARDD
jgi:hypothetical protein